MPVQRIRSVPGTLIRNEKRLEVPDASHQLMDYSRIGAWQFEVVAGSLLELVTGREALCPGESPGS